MTRPGLGFLLLVGTGVLWGTIGVAAQVAFDHSTLDAVSVTWLRALIASPIFLGLGLHTLGRDLFRTTKHELVKMSALGAILIVYQYCYLAAVDEIGITVSTLISLCLPPVLVAAASVPVFREPLTGRLGVSLVGALVGTVMLVGGHGTDRATGSAALGIAFAVVSAAGIATHVMASRSLAGRHHPLRPLAIAFPVGAIVFAPIALGRGLTFHQPAIGWLTVCYLAVGPTVAGYLFYQRGLRDVTATMASIVTLLEPLIAALLAWWFFGERLGPLGFAGGALLIAAIALLSRMPARSREAARLELAEGITG